MSIRQHSLIVLPIVQKQGFASTRLLYLSTWVVEVLVVTGLSGTFHVMPSPFGHSFLQTHVVSQTNHVVSLVGWGLHFWGGFVLQKSRALEHGTQSHHSCQSVVLLFFLV